MRRRFVWVLVACGATLVGTAIPAAAVTPLCPQTYRYYYEALIDIDNNPATGGAVPVQQSGEATDIPGIDYVVTAYADSTSPTSTVRLTGTGRLASIGEAGVVSQGQVVSTQVQEWDSGSKSFTSISCVNQTYPIGDGNGIGGSELVEFEALQSFFSSALPGEATVVFHASQLRLNDFTAKVPLAGTVTAIPALEPWGLLAFALLLLGAAGWFLSRRRRGALMAVVAVTLLLGAGGALRAVNGGFVMDGLNNDWQGISPIVTDPADDSGSPSGPNHDAAEDILYGFFATDGTNAVFRMDIRGAIQPPP